MIYFGRMINMSFLQAHSNDEYVDSQKNAYKIETRYIVLRVAAVDLLQGLTRGGISDRVISRAILLVIGLLHSTLRSAFSGIEHPNVATKKSYKNQRRIVRKSILTSFVI